MPSSHQIQNLMLLKTSQWKFTTLRDSRDAVVTNVLGHMATARLQDKIVWHRPPLRIESKGLVKYRYLIVSSAEIRR